MLHSSSFPKLIGFILAIPICFLFSTKDPAVEAQKEQQQKVALAQLEAQLREMDQEQVEKERKRALREFAKQIPSGRLTMSQVEYYVGDLFEETHTYALSPQESHQLVQKSFKDIPVMARVARCESVHGHYKDGRVVRGKITPDDVGAFQINLRYHLKASLEQGLNVFRPEDNLQYARQLYQNRGGPGDWYASKKCWNKKTIVATR